METFPKDPFETMKDRIASGDETGVLRETRGGGFGLVETTE